MCTVVKKEMIGSGYVSFNSILTCPPTPFYDTKQQLKLTIHEALTTSTATTAAPPSAGTGGVERPKSIPLPPKPPMLGPASLSTASHIAAASTGGAALAEGEPPSLLEAVTGGGSGAGGGKRPPQQPPHQGSGSSSALSSFLDKGTTPPHPPSLLATATGTRAGVGFSTATGGGGESGSSLGPSPSFRRRHSSYTPPDGRRPQRLSRAASSSLSAAAAAALEGIRGLSDDDLLFLKGKLLTAAAAQQPAGSDMVTARDFEAFALWCVRACVRVVGGGVFGWVEDGMGWESVETWWWRCALRKIKRTVCPDKSPTHIPYPQTITGGPPWPPPSGSSPRSGATNTRTPSSTASSPGAGPRPYSRARGRGRFCCGSARRTWGCSPSPLSWPAERGGHRRRRRRGVAGWCSTASCA